MTASGRAPLLRVENLSVRFGGVTALAGVSFDVDHGEILALIGPNGAGKTTAFNAISRLVPATASVLDVDGTDLLRCSPPDLVRLGVSRTFQNLALWPGMTVLENVMVGAHSLGSVGPLRAALGLGTRRERRTLEGRSYALLDLVGIAHLAHEPCADLSFGNLKQVELCRALVSRPRLLMLDEPASGLTHGDVRELAQLLRRLRATLDVTVLLVEHHMQLVMDVADRIVALESGRTLVAGSPAEVREDPRLIAAYLGTRP